MTHLARVFAESPPPASSVVSGARRITGRWPRARQATTIGEHLARRRLVDALADVRDSLAGVEVDRTRLRPVVKVTGEFWAQTTEGDGNFRMFEFLEREGAQVIVEPVGTWITYLLHQAKQRNSDRKGIGRGRAVRADGDLLGRAVDELRLRRANAPLDVAEILFRREWERHRARPGRSATSPHRPVRAAAAGHPYYNSRAVGGEGHLEVAKNIYYSNTGLRHMVLSLKPFGCMPSTQSDAVQSAVTSHFPDMIFLPVETSGEGEINAHSRVQMSLGRRPREELPRARPGAEPGRPDVGRGAGLRRRPPGADQRDLPRAAGPRRRRDGGRLRPARRRPDEAGDRAEPRWESDSTSGRRP